LNQDLDALVLIRDLSPNDYETFKTALQILTSKTFIIRGIEKERDLYDFTTRNSLLFEAWLSCMDASLVRDEGLGVIAFRGSANTRLRFSREEISAALVLRLLYEEKRLEVSLTAYPTVSIREFQDKFNAMAGDDIKKTALIRLLSRLSSAKLISIESHDYADPEATMVLYPSIALSIDRSALDEGMAVLEQRSDEDKIPGSMDDDTGISPEEDDF